MTAKLLEVFVDNEQEAVNLESSTSCNPLIVIWPDPLDHSSRTKCSIFGKRRRQESPRSELLAHVKRSDATHLALLGGGQQKQWLDSRQADREAQVQLVQVLKEAHSQKAVEQPQD
ncbi:hypothetical protein AOLI_G00166460 [Acnodon oligacanthus]